VIARFLVHTQKAHLIFLSHIQGLRIM